MRKNFVTVRRAAESLCLIISKEQCEGSETTINDPIAFLSKEDLPIKRGINKVQVKFYHAL